MPKKKACKIAGLDDSSLDRFSPVKSPAGTPTSGTIVGIPRKIKDLCADTYNFIQKWNELVIAGATVLRKISDLRLQNIEVAQDLSNPQFAASLMPFCYELEDIFRQLEDIFHKLQAITDNFKAIAALDKVCTGSSSQASIKGRSEDSVVFQTWPVDKFVEASEKLRVMYQRELGVKKSVKEEIALLSDSETLTFFVTLWTHQVYIEEISSDILESMLVECGFH